MTLQKVKELIHADTYSKNGDVFTIRREFFYTNGYSSDKLAALVLKKIPGTQIVDHGEVWKPFRGGAPTAKSSHWFVKFSVSDMQEALQQVAELHEAF